MIKQSHNALYHPFFFIHGVQEKFNLYPIIWKVNSMFALFQLFILAVFQLFNQFLFAKQAWGSVVQYYSIVMGFGNHYHYFHSLIMIVPSIVFIICMGIYIKMNQSFQGGYIKQQNKGNNEKLFFLAAILLFFIEFTILIRVVTFCQGICDILKINCLAGFNYRDSIGNAAGIAQIIIDLMVFPLIGVLNSGYHLTWTISLGFSVISIFFGSFAGCSYLLIVGFLYLAKEKQTFQKIIYGILTWTGLWALTQYLQLRDQNGNITKTKQNAIISVIFLAVGALFLAIIFIAKSLEIWKTNSEQQDHKLMEEVIYKLEGAEVDNLTESQIFRVQFIIRKYQSILKSSQNSALQYKKPVQAFQRIDFLLFFFQKMRRQTNDSRNLYKKLLFIRISIILCFYKEERPETINQYAIGLYSGLETLSKIKQQISSLSLKDRYRMFIVQKGIIKKIQILSGKIGNQKNLALSVIETSKQSQEIYRLIKQAFEGLSQFWQGTKERFIFQQLLSQRISRIQEKKQKIQNILQRIGQIYEAKNERFMYKVFCSLISRVFERDNQVFTDQKSLNTAQLHSVKTNQKLFQYPQNVAPNAQQKRRSTIENNNNRQMRLMNNLAANHRNQNSIRISSQKKKIKPNKQINLAVSKNKQNMLSSLSYMLVSGSVIQDISFKFLLEFKYIREELLGKPVYSLLLPGFQGMLENQEKKLFQRLKKDSTAQNLFGQQSKQGQIVPLVDSQGYIVFRTCKIYVLPKLHDGVFLLYQFQRIKCPSSVLICCAENQIGIGITKGFEEKFIKKRNFLQENQCDKNDKKFSYSRKINFPLQKYFIDLDLKNPDLIKKITHSQGYSCKIQLQGRMGRSQVSLVNFFLMEKYSLSNQIFYAFEIKRNGNDKLQTFQLSHSKEATQISMQHNQINSTDQQNLRLQYQDQTFFCPIQNCFAVKIEQKQELLRQSNRVNYPLYFLIAVISFSLLFIGQVVALYYFRSNQIETFKKSSIQLDKRNNQYQNLLFGYYDAYIIFHMVNSANQSILDDYGLNYQDSLIYHQNRLNQKIIQFSKLYLASRNSPYKPDIDIEYMLHFKGFDVEMTSQQTGLMDFVVKLKPTESGRNVTNIQFLLQNYHELMRIQQFFKGISKTSFIDFSQDLTFLENLSIFFQSYSLILIAIFFILYTLIGIIFTILIMKVQKVIEITCSLFTKMENQQIKGILDKIKICENELPKKSLMESKKGDEKSNQLLKIGSQVLQIQEQMTELINQQQKTLKKEGQRVEKVNRNIQNLSSLKLVQKFSLLICVLMLTIMILPYQVYQIIESGSQYKNIANYKQKLYTAHQDFIEETVNKYGKFVQKHLNFQITTDQHYGASEQQKRSLLSHFKRNLPYQLQIFYDQISNLNNGNICQLTPEPIEDPLLANVKCNIVIKGILQEGMAKAMQLYRDTLNMQTGPNQSFSESFVDGDKDRSSNFINLLFTFEKLNQVYLQIERKLNIKIEGFLDAKQKNWQTTCLALLGFCIIIITAGVISYRSLKKRCWICLSYFMIFPKEVIYKTKYTFLIQKSQLLDLINYM